MSSDYVVTDNIIGIPKIKNGSQIKIGKLRALTINVDHHFNWFQKRMINFCFGFSVEDYTEND